MQYRNEMNRKSITSLVLSIFLSLVSYSGAVAAERHRILVTTDIVWRPEKY